MILGSALQSLQGVGGSKDRGEITGRAPGRTSGSDTLCEAVSSTGSSRGRNTSASSGLYTTYVTEVMVSCPLRAAHPDQPGLILTHYAVTDCRLCTAH